MKLFFKVTQFAALFVCLLSFLPTANANNQLPVVEEQPEFITNLLVWQSGPGQITASWDTDCVEWVCQVTILDQTNGAPGVPIIILQPANSPFTYGGLTVGRIYRVIVTDCDTTFGKLIKIMF